MVAGTRSVARSLSSGRYAAQGQLRPAAPAAERIALKMFLAEAMECDRDGSDVSWLAAAAKPAPQPRMNPNPAAGRVAQVGVLARCSSADTSRRCPAGPAGRRVHHSERNRLAWADGHARAGGRQPEGARARGPTRRPVP